MHSDRVVAFRIVALARIVHEAAIVLAAAAGCHRPSTSIDVGPRAHMGTPLANTADVPYCVEYSAFGTATAMGAASDPVDVVDASGEGSRNSGSAAEPRTRCSGLTIGRREPWYRIRSRIPLWAAPICDSMLRW
jgi:hypothetical protein